MKQRKALERDGLVSAVMTVVSVGRVLTRAPCVVSRPDDDLVSSVVVVVLRDFALLFH